jgi:hypothetical protein
VSTGFSIGITVGAQTTFETEFFAVKNKVTLSAALNTEFRHDWGSSTTRETSTTHEYHISADASNRIIALQLFENRVDVSLKWRAVFKATGGFYLMREPNTFRWPVSDINILVPDDNCIVYAMGTHSYPNQQQIIAKQIELVPNAGKKRQQSGSYDWVEGASNVVLVDNLASAGRQLFVDIPDDSAAPYSPIPPRATTGAEDTISDSGFAIPEVPGWGLFLGGMATMLGAVLIVAAVFFVRRWMQRRDKPDAYTFTTPPLQR